jgi:hypothetical protein
MTKFWVTSAVIVGLLTLAAAAGLIVMIVETMFGDLCGNEIFQQSRSPDGQHKVVVFLRSCGATTGFSTQVSILPRDEELSDNDSGNTLICSDDFGRQEIKVEWEGDKRLKLFYSGQACNLSKDAGQTGINVVTVASP